MNRPTIIAAAIATLALAAGLYLGQSWTVGTQGPATAAQSRALTNFQLIDLEGKKTTLAALEGQIIVVNFWATWCPPCREEIPGFIAIQRQFASNGATIVGIALDSADKVGPYAKQMGINYPIVLAGAEGIDLVRSIGNPRGALPFTAILDGRGNIVDRHLGLLTAEALAAKLRGLLGPS